MSKLAIFDIDGTIALHGVIPESVVAGMKHLQERGFLTTVSTGRGYIRMREVLGEHFDTIVSSDALIITEHGTKIVDREGAVVQADYFRENELDHVIDFVRANEGIVKLVWFNSPDPTKRVRVWCADPRDIEAETAKRGHYADVFHSSYEELRKLFAEESLSNISAKLKEYVVVENLKLHFTRSEIDVLFQDSMMEFVRNIADKANAIGSLEKHHGISVENMLVAGNAINDVDMLNLTAGTRILVGEGEQADMVLRYLTTSDQVTRVASPEKLGFFLQGL